MQCVSAVRTSSPSVRGRTIVRHDALVERVSAVTGRSNAVTPYHHPLSRHFLALALPHTPHLAPYRAMTILWNTFSTAIPSCRRVSTGGFACGYCATGSKMTKPNKLTDAERHKPVVDVAREIRASDDPKDFDETFKKVAAQSSEPRQRQR